MVSDANRSPFDATEMTEGGKFVWKQWQPQQYKVF
jgi:hypothetical protein